MSSSFLARSTAGATPVRGTGERGSVNWAFIITLFLLLGFIYAWFSTSDERDKLKSDIKVAQEGEAKANKAARDIGAALKGVSEVVGWRTKTIVVPGTNESIAYTDAALAQAHLSDAGEVEKTEGEAQVKVPGLYAFLKGLKVTYLSQARSGDNKEISKDAAKEVAFTWASQKFKDQLKQVEQLIAAIPAQKPVAPIDDGDVAAQEQYRKDLDAYNLAVKAAQEAQDKLSTEEFAKEYREWKNQIAPPGVWNPDTAKAVEVRFDPPVVARPQTLQELLLLPAGPINSLIAELKANKEADLKKIADMESAVASGEKAIAEAKKALEDQGTQMNAEITKRSQELEQANTRASKLEQEARKAEGERQVAVEEAKKAIAALTAQKNALEAGLAGMKERRDLSIRRDEVDGRLEAVSSDLGTGSIDLGSNAKVFEGLKFQVSYVERGGERRTVGEVQVIKVTGPFSSQVRIVSAATTLTKGMLVSNPFFDAGKTIHVYAVGWTPDFTQRTLLSKMNVVLDAAPTAATDYFVVPDDWKGGLAQPAEGEEGGAPAVSPLEKAQQEAQTFGADVVTKRMLESFLRL